MPEDLQQAEDLCLPSVPWTLQRPWPCSLFPNCRKEGGRWGPQTSPISMHREVPEFHPAPNRQVLGALPFSLLQSGWASESGGKLLKTDSWALAHMDLQNGPFQKAPGNLTQAHVPHAFLMRDTDEGPPAHLHEFLSRDCNCPGFTGIFKDPSAHRSSQVFTLYPWSCGERTLAPLMKARGALCQCFSVLIVLVCEVRRHVFLF